MVLTLNTKIHRPDIDYVVNLMNNIGKVKGIPVSRDKMVALRDDCTRKEIELTNQLIEMIKGRTGIEDLNSIDFNSRIKCKNHVVFLMCKYYNIDSQHFEVVNKSRNIEYRLTKPDMELLRDKLKDQGKDIQLMDIILEVKELKQTVSSMKQFFESLSDFNRRGGKIIDGIFYMYPEFNIVNTKRITTSGPNIQGKEQAVKELITAPDGYKIASMDISGQEVHILLWGIMNNKEIQKNYMELGDPYYAILKYLNMSLTVENRTKTKVPVLGLMNGMYRTTLINQVGDEHIVDTMINTIEKDPGFIKNVTNYVNNSMRQPTKFRKGLFGTTSKIEKYEEREGQNSVRNKLRNGLFQLTAAEITAMSIQSLFKDLYEYDKTLTNLRLLTPIYDEFVFMYKESEEERALEIIDRNMKPIINNWSRFLGEIKTGKSYIG